MMKRHLVIFLLEITFGIIGSIILCNWNFSDKKYMHIPLTFESLMNTTNFIIIKFDKEIINDFGKL